MTFLQNLSLHQIMKYPKKGKTKRHLSKKRKARLKSLAHSPHHQPHGQ
jgi:hypothetical protein